MVCMTDNKLIICVNKTSAVSLEYVRFQQYFKVTSADQQPMKRIQGRPTRFS